MQKFTEDRYESSIFISRTLYNIARVFSKLLKTWGQKAWPHLLPITTFIGISRHTVINTLDTLTKRGSTDNEETIICSVLLNSWHLWTWWFSHKQYNCHDLEENTLHKYPYIPQTNRTLFFKRESEMIRMKTICEVLIITVRISDIYILFNIMVSCVTVKIFDAKVLCVITDQLDVKFKY